MDYRLDSPSSTLTTVHFVLYSSSAHARQMGEIRKLGPRRYHARRGPYDLGEFESILAAKEAIIHEYNRPLNLAQCEAWNTHTGLYA